MTMLGRYGYTTALALALAAVHGRAAAQPIPERYSDMEKGCRRIWGEGVKADVDPYVVRGNYLSCVEDIYRLMEIESERAEKAAAEAERKEKDGEAELDICALGGTKDFSRIPLRLHDPARRLAYLEHEGDIVDWKYDCVNLEGPGDSDGAYEEGETLIPPRLVVRRPLLKDEKGRFKGDVVMVLTEDDPFARVFDYPPYSTIRAVVPGSSWDLLPAAAEYGLPDFAIVMNAVTAETPDSGGKKAKKEKKAAKAEKDNEKRKKEDGGFWRGLKRAAGFGGKRRSAEEPRHPVEIIYEPLGIRATKWGGKADCL